MSCGELPARHPLPCISTSGTGAFGGLAEQLYFLPVDPVQAVIHFCSAIKELIFIRHMHAYTIYMGGGRVSGCTSVYFDFLVSQLSKMSTAKMNNLLESHIINTINEFA